MVFTEGQLKYFAAFIERELGIFYFESNYAQLDFRIQMIQRQLGMDSSSALWDQAKRGIQGPLKSLLLDLATNNETSFYRDPEVFKAFEETVLPALISKLPAGTPLRIWSVACSTGQEPYSVAMVLRSIAERLPLPPFQILCTDYSERVLKRAREGIYSQLDVQRGLTVSILGNYFTQISGDHWRIKESLRENVVFEQLNLLENWPAFGQFDLVLCRNVLIYQNEENRRKIIFRLTEHIKKGAFLVLGGAESISGFSDQFDHEMFDGALLFRKKGEAG